LNGGQPWVLLIQKLSGDTSLTTTAIGLSTGNSQCHPAGCIGRWRCFSSLCRLKPVNSGQLWVLLSQKLSGDTSLSTTASGSDFDKADWLSNGNSKCHPAGVH
jgi:hypothetical protein